MIDLLKAKDETMKEIQPLFRTAEEVAAKNTERVLAAFAEARVSTAHFAATTGYAYGDTGREKLDEVYARVFGAERALVRSQFVSGTHALAAALFGLLRPGDSLVSLTGAPYDTLETLIGFRRPCAGSLKEFGIGYDELPLADGAVDMAGIAAKITASTKVALIQRSRGYSSRKPLTIEDIAQIIAAVKKANPACRCLVDNCYGEFVDTREPTEAGADLVAGSLIKNPGGGLAATGGYLAGKAELVELASYHLTAPGMGGELGASLAGNRLLFQGLFMAPHVVLQAVKGAIFAAALFAKLGYRVWPQPDDRRSDTIQAIELKSPGKLKAFCRAVQQCSPVDSFALPEPWDMPGYDDQVIMAAGTFVEGATSEFSADAPLREPYNVYLQGALSFEHAAYGIMGAARAVLEEEV